MGKNIKGGWIYGNLRRAVGANQMERKGGGGKRGRKREGWGERIESGESGKTSDLVKGEKKRRDEKWGEEKNGGSVI